MTVKEFLSHNKYKILIGVGIAVAIGIIIFIVIWFRKSSNNSCPQGRITSTVCGGNKCIIDCQSFGPNYKYNCTTDTCDCSNNTEMCSTGGISLCCPKGQCVLTAQGPVCCVSSNKCGTKCCPAGQVCSGTGWSSTCQVGCGKDDAGNILRCADNQTCIAVENPLVATIGRLDKQEQGKTWIHNNKDNILYMCVNKNSCSASNPQYSPPAISNFYPCLNGTSTDANFGVGFCRPVTDDMSKIGQCHAYGSASECGGDGNCRWVNVLEEAKTNITKLSSDMNFMTSDTAHGGHGQGDWCLAGNGTSSRVVKYELGGSGCTWQDCWDKLAQPSVIDIDYDESTNTCVAIQDCTGQTGLTSNSENTMPIVPPKAGGNVTLPSDCSAGSASNYCPKVSGTTYTCDGNGSIYIPNPNTYGCTATSSGRQCVQNSGTQSLSDCEANMDSTCGTCGDGYSEKMISSGAKGDLKSQCFRSTLIKNRDGNQCAGAAAGGTCRTNWALHPEKYLEHQCWGGRDVSECHSGGQDQLPVIDIGKYYCKADSIDRSDNTWQGHSWEICNDVNGCVNPAYCSIVDKDGKVVAPCAKDFNGKFDDTHINGIWSTDGDGRLYSGCSQPCDGIADCGANEVCTPNSTFVKTDPVTPNNYPNYCTGKIYS
jgi:hypothetical protein